jgi:hypothetical protein
MRQAYNEKVIHMDNKTQFFFIFRDFFSHFSRFLKNIKLATSRPRHFLGHHW